MFLRNGSGLKWARDKVVGMALGCMQFYTHEQNSFMFRSAGGDGIETPGSPQHSSISVV
jgi:hypothetical protein